MRYFHAGGRGQIRRQCKAWGERAPGTTGRATRECWVGPRVWRRGLASTRHGGGDVTKQVRRLALAWPVWRLARSPDAGGRRRAVRHPATQRVAARAAQPATAAVPVSIAKAERQDVPLWLRGIGTVQALNTVTVRAARRWHADAGAGDRGAGGQAGRRCSRSSILARTRRCSTRRPPRSRRTRRCLPTPSCDLAALLVAGEAELRLAPAGRHPDDAGEPGHCGA